MKSDLPRPEYSPEPPSDSPRQRAAPVRRHRVSAIEGEAEDMEPTDGGGNLSRIFTFLLLLHVFLIGAVVIYNLIADKPAATGQGVPSQVATSDAVNETLEPAVTPRSELTGDAQAIAPEVATVEYIVTPGKNLQNISDETGVPSEQIIALNNLNENGSLYVGRKLRVPLKGGAPVAAVPAAAPVAEAPAAAAPVPAPKAEQSKVAETSKVDAPAKPKVETPAAKPAAVTEAPAKNVEKPAEKRPEPTVAAKAAEKKAEPAAAKLDAPAKPRPAAASASGRTHEVKNGETFYAIARKHDVGVNELMKLNGFSDPGKLRKGTVLKLPAK